MDCAECGSANREGRRFCGGCGAALAAACEACGFVNEAAEKFCGGCGTALAPGSAAALPATIARTRGREPAAQGEAERRQLTVMFCDLVGSTALSARFDPEDLRELIGAFQQASVGVIERMGGIVARYMGAALLVYFGYPQAGEDDAERAVSAGLGVVEAVAALAVPDDVRLRVRVGIATGLVVAGDIVGEGAAEEHAVLGETPNLAARLQGLAEPDTVVIGPVTHRLVGGLFECAELGQHTLKGFPEPVSAWRVMGASEAETRFDALRIRHAHALGGAREGTRPPCGCVALGMPGRRRRRVSHRRSGDRQVAHRPGARRNRRRRGGPHTTQFPTCLSVTLRLGRHMFLVRS